MPINVGSHKSPDPLGAAEERPVRPDRRGRLLGTRIARQILDDVRGTNMVAGVTLPSESEYAERFGVSQRVVRDALRLLSQQGVVETHQGKRAVVGELRPAAVQRYFEIAVGHDESAIDELFELRQAIEAKAAARAAERISDEEVETLAALLAEARQPGLQLDKRVQLDLQFHQRIVQLSGNRFFEAIVDALSGVLETERRREQLLCESLGANHDTSYGEHQSLIMALSSHDSALADQSMRSHLGNVRARVQEYTASNLQAVDQTDDLAM